MPTIMRDGLPSGVNIIDGTGRSDKLSGTRGPDLMRGFTGNDRIFGKAGDDMLQGGAGCDRLHGGDGDDRLHGGDGDDRLDGGAGKDRLFGDHGRDILRGGGGNDRLDGGRGTDTAIFSGDRNDYQIVTRHDVTWVRDISGRDGWEGTDTLRHIEYLRFADQTLPIGKGVAELRGGPEFQVNSTVGGNQGGGTNQNAAALKDGGFVVTWNSEGHDDTEFDIGIFGQRFDADGKQRGEEFQVNSFTVGDQASSTVAGLKDGGFIVTWSSAPQDGSGFGVYAQRYDASGSPKGGEFRVNTYTEENQANSNVAALKDGGFVITWDSRDQDGSGNGVYGQMFGADGSPAGEEFRVNTYTDDNQESSYVASLKNGDFVVTWTSLGQDGSSLGIYGQMFDGSGERIGGEFRVNSGTDGVQYLSSATPLDDGGFVVSWTSQAQQGGSVNGIFAQIYDAAGMPVGGEFRVNTSNQGSSGGSLGTPLKDGGFLLAWHFLEQGDNDYDVYAQRFDEAGERVGGEFGVNDWTDGSQFTSGLATLKDGDVAAVWSGTGPEDPDGVFARMYDCVLV